MRGFPCMGMEKRKILVVEDNRDTRERLVKVLDRAGYDIIEASDGAEAVHHAMLRCPDLILMDLELPLISGDEATRQIKADPHTRDIPIIISTASNNESDSIQRAIAAGAYEVLFKPTELKKILAVARLFMTELPTLLLNRDPINAAYT